jgi:hypothetical protein
MIARMPSADSSRWGRASSALLLAVLLPASCTTDEDIEPHVPSRSGAIQPEAGGALLSEEEACERLLTAAQDAYDRLRCDATFADCPTFLRPGGSSGCYEYYEDSIEACEAAYDDASSCRNLSPCFATAEVNLELPTCEQPPSGEGGAGGAAAGGAGPGGAAAGGEATVPIGGSPDSGGAPAQAGAPAAGAPAGGAN